MLTKRLVGSWGFANTARDTALRKVLLLCSWGQAPIVTTREPVIYPTFLYELVEAKRPRFCQARVPLQQYLLECRTLGVILTAVTSGRGKHGRLSS